LCSGRRPDRLSWAFYRTLRTFLMSCSPRLVGLTGAVLGAMMTALLALPALAQSDDQGESNSRGVRIIDAPTPPPGAGGSAPILKLPSAADASPPLLTPAMPSSAVAVPRPPPPAAVAPVLTPAPVVGETRPAAPVL